MTSCSSAFTFIVLMTIGSTSIAAQAQTVDFFAPQPDNRVDCVAIQPDGKVLIGGWFKNVSGVPRPGLARLNVDGNADSQFRPVLGADYCLLLQPDGKIVTGPSLTRFNPDGMLHDRSIGDIDGEVRCLALAADGKILVGGFFGHIGGHVQTNICRLNPDWTPDVGFRCWADSEVFCMAQQDNGKILIGGNFQMINGQPRTRLCRLNIDGTLDETFNASADATVYAMALQPDGKILVGGYFTSLLGESRTGLARLMPDGSLDLTFNARMDPASSHVVLALTLQTDGKILIAGLFGMVGSPSPNLCRLYPDGHVDTGFNAEVSPSYDDVEAVALQPDGKMVVIGSFASLGGLPRKFVGRLNNTEPATQRLSYDGSILTWMRGGTSPEVWRVVFAVSSDGGSSWTKLGDGVRIPGGWQLGGLSLTLNSMLRARGYTANSFVEAILGPAKVLENPLNTTRNVGTSAILSVYAGGTEPLSYQWLKNGSPLPDAVKVSGAGTPILILTDLLGADTGNYSVKVANSFGTVTSAVAKLTVLDPVISDQPISVIKEIGQDASFTVGVIGTPPFTFQWRKNGHALAGASQPSLVFTNLQSTDAAVYDAVITSTWGSVTSRVALLTINLTLADSFSPNPFGQWSGSVAGLAVEPDGRILVSGSFYSIAEQAYTNLARLNPDGALDANFNPAAYGVYAGGGVMVLPNRKIVVAGDSLNRLNPDGTPDIRLSSARPVSFLLLPSGKFLAGSVRFNPDGTPDATFAPYAYNVIPGGFFTMAAQPDGKIVVGGYYTRYSEVDEDFGFLLRVDAQGKPDTNFNNAVVSNLINPELLTHVESVAVQPDGKILVGGSFSRIGGQYRTNFARLDPDGSADMSFHPDPDGDVSSIALQANGKIVLGGWFTRIGNESRSNLARLYPDGTIDPTFNPGPDVSVWSSTAVALQNDGKILVGGTFSNLAGQPRINLGRLNNNEPAGDSFGFDGSVLTWLRGGSSPEVWATTFACTTNGGLTWTYLGRGARRPDGWKLAGIAAPRAAVFRARGFLTAGLGNGSSSLVESFTGPPGIYTQPVSITNNAGTTADFYIHAGSARPADLQWRKDRQNLSDGANVSGVLTDHLTLTALLHADAGAYSTVFSFAGGSVTSSVATLTVIDPAINIQPLNQITNIGCSVLLGASAAGTRPLFYQWWKDGAAKAGATQQSLLLSNVQLSDAGNYVLIVSNSFGTVFSTAAVVTVQAPAADSLNPGAPAPVECLALQTNGSILAAGAYSSFERLTPDGQADPSFRPLQSGSGSVVDSLSVLRDGTILAAGSFNTISGRTRHDIARFNPGGALDGFSPDYLVGTIHAVLEQPDGRIIVGGYFDTAPQNTHNLARFNRDGSLDTSFDPGMHDWSPDVNCLLSQPDGKILVAGRFTSVAGQVRTNIARLNPDGSLDANFNANLEDPVTSLALQADDRILVATTSASMSDIRSALRRLNSDGTLDTNFSTVIGGNYSPVVAMALQTDGRILIGGYFDTINGQKWGNLARLNPDGSLDTGFSPQAGGTYLSSVNSIAVQSDGRIVVGGWFLSLAGQWRTNIGRLENNEVATQSLTFDGSTVTWLRGGGSPEIWRASFEYSRDGNSWVSLGNGTRRPGGWQLSGLSLPVGSTLRAGGFIQNGSGSWFVENSIPVGAAGQPFILQDHSLGFASGNFGFNVIGAPGQVVVIETSENLADWTPVETRTLASEHEYFSDPAGPSSVSRFYRLRLEH